MRVFVGRPLPGAFATKFVLATAEFLSTTEFLSMTKIPLAAGLLRPRVSPPR